MGTRPPRGRVSLVWTVAAIAALACSMPGSGHAYPSLSYGWQHPDSSHVTINWTMTEDPLMPIDVPAWAGWDIWRVSLDGCGTTGSVNDAIFPRDPGQTHSYSFTDQPPPGAYEYRIVSVDANRAQVVIPEYQCDTCHHGHIWTSVPDLASPVAVGTLEDIGWALVSLPCPGSCYSAVTFEDASGELRPYADGHTVVHLFGSFGCCTIEGPAMSVDHYVIAPCDGIVSTARQSWGRLKSLYR